MVEAAPNSPRASPCNQVYRLLSSACLVVDASVLHPARPQPKDGAASGGRALSVGVKPTGPTSSSGKGSGGGNKPSNGGVGLTHCRLPGKGVHGLEYRTVTPPHGRTGGPPATTPVTPLFITVRSSAAAAWT